MLPHTARYHPYLGSHTARDEGPFTLPLAPQPHGRASPLPQLCHTVPSDTVRASGGGRVRAAEQTSRQQDSLGGGTSVCPVLGALRGGHCVELPLSFAMPWPVHTTAGSRRGSSAESCFPCRAVLSLDFPSGTVQPPAWPEPVACEEQCWVPVPAGADGPGRVQGAPRSQGTAVSRGDAEQQSSL